jgi:hypothetical protein
VRAVLAALGVTSSGSFHSLRIVLPVRRWIAGGSDGNGIRDARERLPGRLAMIFPRPISGASDTELQPVNTPEHRADDKSRR